jgi:hypothetical protein
VGFAERFGSLFLVALLALVAANTTWPVAAMVALCIFGALFVGFALTIGSYALFPERDQDDA